MKAKHFILIGTALLLRASNVQAYYAEVEDLKLEYAGPTYQKILDDDTRYLKQEFKVTNTGEEALKDVGVVWQFMYSGNWVFDYDTVDHRWEQDIVAGGQDYGEHWLQIYTQDPSLGATSDYYSMAEITGATAPVTRTLTNGAYQRIIALDETDEVPVFWLVDGDGILSPHESVDFILYARQGPYTNSATGGGWSFNLINTFIADVTPVPIPGALLLMGSGLAALWACRRRNISECNGTE